MALIMIFFTIYAIVQYVIYKDFFKKAQYTLELMVNTKSREPYLAATFNALREEIAAGHAIVVENSSNFCDNSKYR